MTHKKRVSSIPENFKSSGFRVLGIKAQGFSAADLAFKGSEFRVQWFSVQDLKIQGSGFKVQNLWIYCQRFKIRGFND